MTYKINISDLSLNQLNAACLVKISHFAVALEKYNGSLLELNSDTLMKDLVTIAKSTNNQTLQLHYRSIKREISKHINSGKFNKPTTVPNGFTANPLSANTPTKMTDKKL